MIYKCKNCGNEIAENAKFCTHCGTPATPETPVQQTPYGQQAAYTPQQGLYQQPQPQFGRAQAPYVDYSAAVAGAVYFLIGALVALALGAGAALCGIIIEIKPFVWLGAVLCLTAELIALAPKGKFDKAFRAANQSINNRAHRDEWKRLRKEAETQIKRNNKAYAACFPVAVIALAALLVTSYFIR